MARSLKDRLAGLNFTCLWLLLCFGPVILAILTVLLYRTPLWYLPFLYVLWYFYDYGVEERGGRKWLWYKAKWNIACYKHFGVKLVKTCDLSPEKNYILGCHPHGQFCFGPLAAYAFDAADFDTVFPGITPKLCLHSAFFTIPLARECFLAAGMISASKKGIEQELRLSPKGGLACALSIGGAQETVEEWTSHISLILKNRKGFVKMAIRHGAHLVPSFTFGENLTYRQIRVSPDSKLKRLQQWLLSKSIVLFCFTHGRAALFGEIGIVPYRVPLTIVIGRPIHVTQKDNPTQEEIDHIHGQYVDALKALYDAYNPIYGNPDTPIVIK